MNYIFKIASTMITALLAFSGAGYAQSNPNANPTSISINASSASMPLSSSRVVTFQLGNNGSNPIPANGADWTVSFPNIVTVNQASLNLNGGPFSAQWNVGPGGTILFLNVIAPGIPARVFNGPQTTYLMTVSVTGSATGGPLQFTLSNENNALIAGNGNSGDDNINGPISVTPSALPVKLMEFTATSKGCKAALNWKSASELDVEKYDVEVSADGFDFSQAGTVKAAGTTITEQRYGFDYAMKPGNTYFFRLKMVDKNGSYSYSQVQKAACNDNATGVVIAPNPVVSSVTISGMNTGTNTITILDVKGKQVTKLSVTDREANIDCTAFASGVYTIRIEDERGEVINKKLVKQ